jgi:hypothetical protein
MANELVDKGEIDLVRYGQLWQKVETLDRKMDKIEDQMTELLALANKSKGGLWTGMVIASAIGGVAGFIAHWMTMK